jgi:hypothetical protein
LPLSSTSTEVPDKKKERKADANAHRFSSYPSRKDFETERKDAVSEINPSSSAKQQPVFSFENK